MIKKDLPFPKPRPHALVKQRALEWNQQIETNGPFICSSQVEPVTMPPAALFFSPLLFPHFSQGEGLVR